MGKDVILVKVNLIISPIQERDTGMIPKFTNMPRET